MLRKYLMAVCLMGTCLVGGAAVDARPGDDVSSVLPEHRQYVEMVHPLLVQTMLVVREPVGVGQAGDGDLRGQIAALQALLKQSQEVSAPPAMMDVHRAFQEGLEDLSAGIELKLQAREAEAQRRMQDGQEKLNSVSEQLHGVLASTIGPQDLGGESDVPQ